MRFHLKADVMLDAKDEADALNRLGRHFFRMDQFSFGDPEDTEFVGDIKLSRVVPDEKPVADAGVLQADARGS